MGKYDKSWRDKALEATHWNGSKFGAILACAFGRNAELIEGKGGIGSDCPRFEGTASVTSDGYVMCSFVDKHGEGHMGAFVGSRDDVLANVRGLSEHLQLGPRERLEFRCDIGAWLGEAIEGKPAS